jgi:hypothetical protein
LKPKFEKRRKEIEKKENKKKRRKTPLGPKPPYRPTSLSRPRDRPPPPRAW